MKQSSWLADNIKSLTGLIIIIGVISYLFMVTLTTNDTTVHSQALIAMVSLGTAVVSYYYGYSQGASKKDDAQAQLTANSQTTQTTVTTAPIVDTATTGTPVIQQPGAAS